MKAVILFLLAVSFQHAIFASVNFSYPFVCKSRADEQVYLYMNTSSNNEMVGHLNVTCKGVSTYVPLVAQFTQFPPENVPYMMGGIEIIFDFNKLDDNFGDAVLIMEGSFTSLRGRDGLHSIEIVPRKYDIIPDATLPPIVHTDKISGKIDYAH